MTGAASPESVETLRLLGWQPRFSTLMAVDAPRAADASLDLVISEGDMVGWEETLDGGNRLKGLYRALKRGGILGVIEARAETGTAFKAMMQARALTEDHVVLLAEVAGFRLALRSDVNAERPPRRMTLKFVKP